MLCRASSAVGNHWGLVFGAILHKGGQPTPMTAKNSVDKELRSRGRERYLRN
jgi:hypothetical protein